MEFKLNRVKAERIAAGISQQQMAEKLGMSRTSYWKRENGKVPIGADELAQIARIIGIPSNRISIFFSFDVPERQRSS